ncbi:MAG: hypothetical protein GF416_01280 [Candidatus Altiarchaeales archaeon]|nr:hypothetical protein [Candidatus Altiarchaeales archaeon]MBD3415748.1 hypothetical protein [Candidatus Altiarchaeales archaeon]
MAVKQIREEHIESVKAQVGDHGHDRQEKLTLYVHLRPGNEEVVPPGSTHQQIEAMGQRGLSAIKKVQGETDTPDLDTQLKVQSFFGDALADLRTGGVINPERKSAVDKCYAFSFISEGREVTSDQPATSTRNIRPPPLPRTGIRQSPKPPPAPGHREGEVEPPPVVRQTKQPPVVLPPQTMPEQVAPQRVGYPPTPPAAPAPPRAREVQAPPVTGSVPAAGAVQQNIPAAPNAESDVKLGVLTVDMKNCPNRGSDMENPGSQAQIMRQSARIAEAACGREFPASDAEFLKSNPQLENPNAVKLYIGQRISEMTRAAQRRGLTLDEHLSQVAMDQMARRTSATADEKQVATARSAYMNAARYVNQVAGWVRGECLRGQAERAKQAYPQGNPTIQASEPGELCFARALKYASERVRNTPSDRALNSTVMGPPTIADLTVAVQMSPESFAGYTGELTQALPPGTREHYQGRAKAILDGFTRMQLSTGSTHRQG